MKYADYYSQFFDERGLMQVALDATLRILKPTKGSVAKSRSENLIEFQKKGVLPSQYDFNFDDDIRIDQLAEFGDTVTRKIWGSCISTIETARKKDKSLPPLPEVDLIAEVTQFWKLEQYLPQIRAIQRINESLKENKLKGNTGGVPYEWYYLAAKYLEHNPGIEDIRPVGEALINLIVPKIEAVISQHQIPDGWDDVRDWVKRVVMLPDTETSENSAEQADIFLNTNSEKYRTKLIPQKHRYRSIRIVQPFR